MCIDFIVVQWLLYEGRYYIGALKVIGNKFNIGELKVGAFKGIRL